MTRRSPSRAVTAEATHGSASLAGTDGDYRGELRGCLLRAGVAVVGALASLGPGDGGVVADPVELGRQLGLLRDALAAVEATFRHS